jgi:uncharacterized protein (TIGR03083 family)
MVTEAFLSAATTVSGLLRSSALTSRWTEPSALREFRISGLAGHLARAVFNVETYLARPLPAGVPMDAVSYFLEAADGTDLTSADNRQIRERGEADAGPSADDLVARYDAALARLAAELPALDGARPVPMVGGRVLTLDECLITRLVELLVHADDLAVSLDVPTPDFDDEAADLVVTALARTARRRHGTVPVLRGLARHERGGARIAAF